MPFSTYKVRTVFKDPSKITLFGESVDANRNNIAILDFPNDDGLGNDASYFVNGNDLSDARIDAQARAIVVTLNEQEASLASVTIGKVTTPSPIDPKLQTLLDAQTTFGKASQAAMVKFRNDPDELAAYADLVAAQDALVVATPVSLALSKIS